MMITDLTAYLDPELRPTFAALDDLVDGALDPERGRAFRAERSARLAALPPNPRVESTDRAIASHVAGDPPVTVRLHRPHEATTALPVVVWLHGGGFCGGSIDADRSLCERLCDDARIAVLAVEYRLSPENVFPAALNDAYSALLWLTQSADELGIDPTRLAVAGQSAGGALTASVALMARDRGELELRFQMPLYGAFDDHPESGSASEIMDPRSWNRNLAATAWRAYLGPHADSPPRYAVALREDDLSGLPDAYMMVGQFDMHRDENIAYATRLLNAGVSVEFHVYPKTFHGFEVLIPGAAISAAAIAEWQGALGRALTTG